jgi:hypothetical protein
MRFYIAAVMAMFGASASAQTYLDAETPQYDFEIAYQKNIQTVLHEAYADNVIVRMVGEPSFSPEYAVGLRKSAAGVFIFSVQTKIQIWVFQSRDQELKDARACDIQKYPDCAYERKYLEAMPTDIHDIGLERCEVPVPGDVEAHIEDAWRLSLATAGKSGDDRVGVDGEFYHFAMNDGGRHLGGRIWTPDANSLPGMLFDLGLDMKKLCTGSSNITVTQIDREASVLVQKLKELE